MKRRDISSSHNDLNSDTTRSSRKTELDKELLSATKIGDLSKVKDLINQGARINAEDKDGNTPFHNAALKGHLTIAQYLVEKGVDVNASNEDGWTPMHGAALKGHLEVIRFLIEKGANISAENIFGEKPIHCAAKRNNKDIIEVLLRKGASINDADKNGRTPLYFASWNGYLGLVEYFVRDKKANINIKDKYGKTPLDVAIDRNHISVIGYLSKKQLELCKELLVVVQSGDLSKVQDLVNQGASLDIQSEDGLTLLHFASINNRLDIAGYLIKEGVDINAKDKDGKTPLHYASRSVHHLDMVQYLISKGADIDVKDNSGRTPEDEERYTNSDRMRQVFMQAHLDRELLLTVKNEKDLKTINNRIAKDIDDRTHGGFYYTWSGNLDIVKFLVSRDVSVNTTDKYGCTLLHWSALKGHSSIAEFLVDKEANVNAKDILGRTPMHFAVMNNHKDIQDVYGRDPTYTTAESNDEEIVQLFLMKGASINEADENGETPLHLASWDGHLGILQHLINNGANIGTKDSSGKTPLDIARDKGHNNLVQYLQQTQLILDKQLLIAIESSDLNKVRGLIAQGANIDTKDKDGSTLLYSAAEIGDLDRIKFLLDNGANIETKNGEYQATPLHGAVANYRIDIVKLLLNRGANVNAEDKDNWRPLHYAADTNSLDIIKVLVDAHANLGAKGNYSKTPLDIAKDKGHNNIVEYLEKKFREERGEPLQRKRRHHHGDHNHHHMSRKPLAIDSSNQPEIATSSVIRPSSWINDCISWVKSSIGKLLNSKSEGTTSSVSQVDGQIAKASISNSSLTSTTLPSDRTDEREESGDFSRDNVDYVNANLKRMCERQAPVKFKPKDRNTILEMGDHYLSQIDFNGTITLFDLLIRRVTGQKYISTVDQSISPLEAQEYTLNITKGFEKVVEQAGLKSGVSMHRLNIDYMRMQKEITKKVMSGKFDEISGVLNSYVEKVCPDRETGCPGKLSLKKFDKFMIEFNKGLDVTLNQSMQQILNTRNSTLEVNDVKEQQIGLEPKSYFSNTSIQGHLTKNKVKLIS